MPDKTVTEVRIEVDKKNTDIIWVYNVEVNPDRLTQESMQGLPYNNPAITYLTQEMWGGDKDERAELAKAGITSEIKVDIPIWFKHGRFTTDQARKAIRDFDLDCGLPYCLNPLKDAGIRKTLRENHGVWHVVALGQSNKKLLQFGADSHPVVLNMRDADLGFRLGWAENVWLGHSAVVSSPQVSR